MFPVGNLRYASRMPFWGQPAPISINQTLAVLHLSPGQVVGAALVPELETGIAAAVGPRGRLVRIEPDTEGDPHLQVASLHTAVVSDAVLRLPFPERTLAHIRSALRPEGHLFVRTNDSSIESRFDAAGFDFVARHPGLLEFVRP